MFLLKEEQEAVKWKPNQISLFLATYKKVLNSKTILMKIMKTSKDLPYDLGNNIFEYLSYSMEKLWQQPYQIHNIFFSSGKSFKNIFKE